MLLVNQPACLWSKRTVSYPTRLTSTRSKHIITEKDATTGESGVPHLKGPIVDQDTDQGNDGLCQQGISGA